MMTLGRRHFERGIRMRDPEDNNPEQINRDEVFEDKPFEPVKITRRKLFTLMAGEGPVHLNKEKDMNQMRIIIGLSILFFLAGPIF
jgi:hypothetical protein